MFMQFFKTNKRLIDKLHIYNISVSISVYFLCSATPSFSCGWYLLGRLLFRRPNWQSVSHSYQLKTRLAGIRTPTNKYIDFYIYFTFLFVLHAFISGHSCVRQKPRPCCVDSFVWSRLQCVRRDNFSSHGRSERTINQF